MLTQTEMLDGESIRKDMKELACFHNLKLTRYQSNPLEPTREVWERYKGYMEKYSSMQSHDRLPALLSYEFWKAIQESVRRTEGGE